MDKFLQPDSVRYNTFNSNTMEMRLKYDRIREIL